MKRTPTHDEIIEAQDKAKGILQLVRQHADSISNKVYDMDCDVSQDELYDDIADLHDKVTALISSLDKAEDEIELALLKEDN